MTTPSKPPQTGYEIDASNADVPAAQNGTQRNPAGLTIFHSVLELVNEARETRLTAFPFLPDMPLPGQVDRGAYVWMREHTGRDRSAGLHGDFARAN
ncbi:MULTISPECIES: hypothetical protein [unclassified Novosphingobium]|uniref:hypothetical protein n=1 Tax=unclassified Novosphingobium TaxID=2644732 RepID=UPI00135825EC|nr:MULTISPECIES: hypothetical protein [unclassified Novosphingobium]